MITVSAPPGPVNCAFRLSGSKSISNRLLMINALSEFPCKLINLSSSEDTLLLQKALMMLKNKSHGVIDVHHAGTNFRFLTALLSTIEGSWELTGSERLQQRPIGELVHALTELGADIVCMKRQGYPPLKINGTKLRGGSIEIEAGTSSQFVSALLLIAPTLENGLELVLKGKVVSRPYIEMTISLLKQFGASVKQNGACIRVEHSALSNGAEDFHIESDWSSASYWFGICALSKQSRIELSVLDQRSLQADSVLPRLFDALGVQTEFKESTVLLTSKAPSTHYFEYDFTDCPDIAQTIAVTCLGQGINARLTGLSTLVIKETDRIRALKTELEKFGATITITGDTLNILTKATGVPGLTEPTEVDTYNDHRMAMSFAMLASHSSAIRIKDPGVVDKSYPSFWEDLKTAGFSVDLHP